MKGFGFISLLLAIMIACMQGCGSCSANAEYTREIGSEWTLADRASLIQEKSEHIDKFVDALERANLKGMHNAVLYQTPENSFDTNLTALKSLQKRLKDIESMDVRSFEYQTAIQQITAQEQGEAHAMLNHFYGCWMLKNHPSLWGWYSGIFIIVAVILGFLGVICLAIGFDLNL